MGNWNVSNVDQLIDVLINKKLQGMSLSSSSFQHYQVGWFAVQLHTFGREEGSVQQFLLSVHVPNDLPLLPFPFHCAAEF